MFTAIRDDGSQKKFNNQAAATMWLAGLKPGQTWNDFQYPAPGGRVYDSNGTAVVGVGADGGAVSFRRSDERTPEELAAITRAEAEAEKKRWQRILG